MKSLAGKIKFGIIGCSSIAERCVLPAIKDTPVAEIGMIGSRSPEKAQKYSDKFGCASYGTYDDVLNNENIDAVYISLPVGLHEEWTVKAAEAGKHVLCEKSSTTCLVLAKRMVAACQKHNVRLLEGFMFRYHPQHQKVISLIKDSQLGHLLMFQGNFGFPPPPANDIRWRQDLGGGVLNDAVCYPIYASRMLFQEEPLDVDCRLTIDPKTGVDTKADIMLRYSNGKAAFISSAFGAYFQSTYSLWGTKAYLTMKRAYAIPKDRETSIYVNADDKVNEIVIKPADHFQLMIDGFCAEILSKKHQVDFESDLLAQATVLEAARLSNKEDRIVKLSELI